MKGDLEDMKHEVKEMKIKWLEYKNLETDLEIKRINFFDDLTLLVGLSGAGKTQILNTIEFSIMLSLGKVKIMRPCEVSIGVNINNHIYEWRYKIKKEKSTSNILFDNDGLCFFEHESLICDEEIIFSRASEKISIKDFENIPTPRKDKSLIYQFSDDSHFKELVDGFKKLYNIDMDFDVRQYLQKDSVNKFKTLINKTLKKKRTIDISIFSHLPTPLKLYVAKSHYPETFEQILDNVSSIFQEIDDIDIIEDPLRDCYCVQITVYGKKILQKDISNGMLKSIYFIIELFTAPKNSLIMIDEFENGLGMNCINAISELLINERNDLQFIITSHHPKIIGDIDFNLWKIIEREKNIVNNYNYDDERYDLGGNRHDAYYNLLQKWDFEGKI